MAACHTGEGKPYGNKYLPNEGERADIWHWKSVRTGVVGQSTISISMPRDSTRTIAGGRSQERPQDRAGTSTTSATTRKGRNSLLKGNKPAPPYWIVDSEKEPFDDSKYKAGDEVPGIIVAPFTGTVAISRSNPLWKDGAWTLVFSRKLVTNSEFDVQFNDMKKQYAFGWRCSTTRRFATPIRGRVEAGVRVGDWPSRNALTSGQAGRRRPRRLPASSARRHEWSRITSAVRSVFLVAWLVLIPASALAQPLFSPSQDPLAGARVFDAKGCIKCHAVGGTGGKVGPDLARTARPRTFYDLAADSGITHPRWPLVCAHSESSGRISTLSKPEIWQATSSR
jgi:hypothetical protein